MSVSDFRQIAIRSEAGQGERLFRAVISAFCSLPRPTRREIAQAEELALSLFEGVSVESRRFVAAALSESEYPPAALVRRLCEEPVDIAAPLLIRSNALTDIDLIALIGRHGLPHARAIARRKGLTPAIADLIRVLEKPTLVHVSRSEPERAATEKTASAKSKAKPALVPGERAEATRHKLRTIMAGAKPNEVENINASGASTYAKLRETALTGNAAFFHTALADALGLDFATARALMTGTTYSSLLVALRALDLVEDKAFLIAVAVYPRLFPHPEAIRIFLDRFRTLHLDVARTRVDEWRAQGFATALQKPTTRPAQRPANADDQATAAKRPDGLKAS